MPSLRHSSAMLSSPRRPSSTMRILSPAEKCRRVWRRTSFTTASAGAFVGDFFRGGLGLHLRSFVTTFGKVASGDAAKDAEIRQLKRDLARMTEERDILKKATAYFAKDAK